jgi:uncharacterized protein YndB with AHSA1/START domain
MDAGTDTDSLRFVRELPRPPQDVWPLVAGHGERLGEWLAVAEVFEPRLGGAVTLRRPDGTAAAGRITAWDVERVAEYALEDGRVRLRLHLEPHGEQGTTLRLTAGVRGGRPGDDELGRGSPAVWHDRLTALAEALGER